jgi:hypothetical protein
MKQKPLRGFFVTGSILTVQVGELYIQTTCSSWWPDGLLRQVASCPNESTASADEVKILLGFS